MELAEGRPELDDCSPAARPADDPLRARHCHCVSNGKRSRFRLCATEVRPGYDRLELYSMPNMTRSARGEAAIVMPLLGELAPPLAEREQQEMSFQFAHMMSVAAQYDMLPLDLTGLPEDLTRAN
jgi:hypothetical protein